MNYTDIPTGISHINTLESVGKNVKSQSEIELKKHHHDTKLYGTSMSILYQASTCHRECLGGPHILETLSGRAYNLGQASYTLILHGLYDEALSLIRSIGEISNLISMSVVDKKAFDKWVKADKNTRIKKFSPAKIRNILGAKKHAFIPANKEWYSYFCESYTHITPSTNINSHNDAEKSYIGPTFQKEGLSSSIKELSYMMFTIAAHISKYFKYEDLFEELNTLIQNEKANK